MTQKTNAILTSRLRLSDHWIEDFSYSPNDEWISGGDVTQPSARYSVERRFNKEKTGVLVRLRLTSPRTAKKNRGYTFALTVVGVFDLSRPIEDEDEESLDNHFVQFNTVSILYGLARGFLTTATAICLNGPVQLPSANFVLSERKAQERTATAPARTEI